MGIEEGKKVFENLTAPERNLNDLADFVIAEDSTRPDVFGRQQKESAYLKVRKTLSSKEEKDKFRDIVISKIAERERVREIERKNLVGEMAASIHDRKAVDAEAARRTAFNPRAEQRPWEKEQE